MSNVLIASCQYSTPQSRYHVRLLPRRSSNRTLHVVRFCAKCLFCFRRTLCCTHCTDNPPPLLSMLTVKPIAGHIMKSMWNASPEDGTFTLYLASTLLETCRYTCSLHVLFWDQPFCLTYRLGGFRRRLTGYLRRVVHGTHPCIPIFDAPQYYCRSNINCKNPRRATLYCLLNVICSSMLERRFLFGLGGLPQAPHKLPHGSSPRNAAMYSHI